MLKLFIIGGSFGIIDSTFDNTHYFDIIDCIRNKDRNGLNKIISPIEVSIDEFEVLRKAYTRYENNPADAVKGLGKDIDYTYGFTRHC